MTRARGEVRLDVKKEIRPISLCGLRQRAGSKIMLCAGRLSGEKVSPAGT